MRDICRHDYPVPQLGKAIVRPGYVSAQVNSCIHGATVRFKCMLSVFIDRMGSTTITISDAAYGILKAQKKEGESFSDVILRTFPRGNPARILASLDDLPALDDATAERIKSASEEIRQNFKTRVPEV